MLRKTVYSIAAVSALVIATPAMATHFHKPGCGHYPGSSTSSSWGGGKDPSSSTGGNTTGGNTTGGSTSSGGTQVPEPGMLGMVGAGLMGLGFIRLRRRKKA